jgi:colanic acid biosynthesis glycosyl transferase WcaI
LIQTAAHGTRLRVLFVNRFYAPDVSATSQMLTDLAQALARDGAAVTVVCSRQLYQDPAARLPAHDSIGGVSVCRIGGTRFGRDRLAGRAFDYLSFCLAASATLLKLARQVDVIVTKTDPPLLSLVGWLVAARRGVPYVNWLQDLFPEVASRLALSPLPRPLERLLCALRDRSLRAAECNVVLGTRMRDYLTARGIPAARLRISENWADEAALVPLAPADSVLRRQQSLGERFVVTYSGNLGRVHDVQTLLEAAELLRADRTTVFLMIGGGANMRALASEAQARGLQQLRFLPYQPRSALPDSLAAGDVHLVTLLPQLEGLVVPSKLYGILAAGRPVVFVGDTDGELARLIREHRVGVAIASGDAPALRDALCRLRDEPAERIRMGARARALFEQRYTLSAAVQRWQAVLAEVSASWGRTDPDRLPASRQTG